MELKLAEHHGGIRDIARGNSGYQESQVSRHFKADRSLIDVAIYGRSLIYKGRSSAYVGDCIAIE
ncbi:MAG: hypothetical protein WAV72_28175, partial [Bradyrhizobium sp.]